MKKIIGILLIIIALVLGYFGVKQFQGSTNKAEVLGVELNASDKGGQQTAYIEIALAAAALIGGVVLVSQKDKK